MGDQEESVGGALQCERAVALEGADDGDPGRVGLLLEQLALVLRQGAGDNEFEPFGVGGLIGSETGQPFQKRSRIAAGRAEAAGVDERDAVGVEKVGNGRGVGGFQELRVRAVPHQDRIGDPALAKVGGGGFRDAHDGVRGAKRLALEPQVHPLLKCRWERAGEAARRSMRRERRRPRRPPGAEGRGPRSEPIPAERS